MYKLSFWFEHGGECLWSKNEKARETAKKYIFEIKGGKRDFRF